MFSYKKIVAIVTSVLYIFVNYDFYNSIFHEYTNNRLFHITTWLGIVEALFWITLFLSVFQLEDKSIQKGDRTREEKEKEIKQEIYKNLYKCTELKDFRNRNRRCVLLLDALNRKDTY